MDSIPGSDLYWFSDSNVSFHHASDVFHQDLSRLFSLKAAREARYQLLQSDIDNNGTQLQLNSSKTSNNSEISLSNGTPEPSRELVTVYSVMGIEWRYFIMILYIFTSLVACVFNILTMFVLWCGRRNELTKYLINLSFSDILMNLSAFDIFSLSMSVTIMAVIGINRYQAITNPLGKGKGLMISGWTLRENYVIIAIWTISFVIAFPNYLSVTSKLYLRKKEVRYTCQGVWSEFNSNLYSTFIYIYTFAIPLLLLACLHTAIGMKLWRRQIPGNVNAKQEQNLQAERLKIVRMLIVVVTVFAISWFPAQTFAILTSIYSEYIDLSGRGLAYCLFMSGFFGFRWLGMAHSCFNPIILFLMSDNFRSDFLTLICRRDKSNKNTSTNSNSNNASSSSGTKSTHVVSSESGGDEVPV